MHDRGYLVLGPESSGTRVTTRLLEAAGCRRFSVLGGDDGPEPPADGRPPVIRRSAPHWRPPAGPHEWPDVPALAAFLDAREVLAVVTTRDWFAMAASQVARTHVRTEGEAHRNVRRAYRVIFDGLARAGVGHVVSSYEAFVSRAAFRRALLASLGLPPADVQIRDANARFYETLVPFARG